jgi:hypothetical protein
VKLRVCESASQESPKLLRTVVSRETSPNSLSQRIHPTKYTRLLFTLNKIALELSSLSSLSLFYNICPSHHYHTLDRTDVCLPMNTTPSQLLHFQSRRISSPVTAFHARTNPACAPRTPTYCKRLCLPIYTYFRTNLTSKRATGRERFPLVWCEFHTTPVCRTQTNAPGSSPIQNQKKKK